MATTTPANASAAYKTEISTIAKVDFASTANGDGAALVGIEDAGGKFTATDVEGALEELYDGGLVPIDNNGETTVVTYTLPVATVGLVKLYARDNVDHVMHVDPNGTEYFIGSTAGLYKSFDSDGAYMKLECLKAGTWHIVASYGVISDE